MEKSNENSTLFIRNIPFHFSQGELEDKFSEYGPIKQCFIVNDKVSGKSRGFGYVKFTLLEDAKKAKEGNIKIEGRKVLIDYADRSKKVKRPLKKKIKEEDGEEVSEDVSYVTEKVESKENIADEVKKSGQSLKYHNAKIVALRGLPDGMSEEELNKCIKSIGVKSLAECNLLGSGKEAQLKFKCVRDAKRAIRKLHNHSYKDSMLQATQMSQDSSRQLKTPQRQSRVIVRNLSFQCTEEQLQKAFMNCGEIVEVKIPSNKDGKKIGFGFVQFSQLNEAKRAVEEMNSKKILGRSVAVDWALPKATYENTQKNTGSEDFDEESDSDDDSTTENIKQKKQKISPIKIKKEVEDDDDDSKAEESKHDSSDEESVSENSDDDDVEEDDDDDEEDDEDDDDEDDDEEDDGDDDEDDDDEATDKNSKQAVKKRIQKSDTDDGCTLFIRNLSFDSIEEDVENCFSQYGELKYAKIVFNHETEHSKGIGFVRYSNKLAADQCLEDAKDNKISLDGRVLIVTVAVSRENAASLAEKNKKEKEKKDNRNLYLAREGLIRAGTQQAEGLTKIDLDKRQKVEELKRQKLKNLNIFISPLRLCIRNIPVNVTDKKLREIFKTAAGNKHAKINECKIMRDRTRTNADGLGKSKGFGFVSFSDHQHALTALRQTNNNPEIFGDKKRLIVEFSLENRKALETKERRKSKIKAKVAKKDHSTDGKVKVKPSSVIPLIHLSEKDKKLKGEKVVKGLPSHWGPKIRHKPRQGQVNQGKKGQSTQKSSPHNVAVKRKQSGNQTQDIKQKKQKKAHHKETVDDFDKIVSRYKNNLISKKRMTNKWFERE